MKPNDFPPHDSNDTASIERLHAVFTRQQLAFTADGTPPAAVRRDRIDRAIGILVDHRQALCDALSASYGHRSQEQSAMLDIGSTIEALKYCRKHLDAWMQPERRRTNFPSGLLGARAQVRYEPKGVIGNIAPWNFPVYFAFGPTAAMFAAGNRSIVKISELTPRTATLIQTLIAENYAESEFAAFCGGPALGAAFAALPFDHIFFTGSTRVGKMVMQKAAANLCPVTLELGGKSPVVIGEGADVVHAARRVAWGKLLNSGQVCLAPDYLFVPERQLGEFTTAFADAVASLYPRLLDNPDYTAMISAHHLARLQGYVAEAREAGAKVIEINPANEDFAAQSGRKMMPTLIVDPPNHLQVMQDEIFGPVLPIKTYTDLDGVIAHINSRPHPLAIYLFAERSITEKVLSRTRSGGVVVDDVILHVMQEDLPFGGIGQSGMGAYHAEAGFRSFSHARSVMHSTRLDPVHLLKPPYGERARRILNFIIKR